MTLAAFFLLALGGFVLWTELAGVAANDEATISELVWLVWAHQPWIIWLISVVVAFVVGFLSGHFVAQAREVYAQIRQRS